MGRGRSIEPRTVRGNKATTPEEMHMSGPRIAMGAVGLVAALVVAGGMAQFMPQPTEQEEQKSPVAIAAECANFPPAIASILSKNFDPQKATALSFLPADYDITQVVVYSAGGCLSTPGNAFAPLPSNHVMILGPAVSFLEKNGGKFPLYVIWEQPPQHGSSDRVFVTIRLPALSAYNPKAGPDREA